MSASMSSASSRQRTATSRYNFRMPLSSDSSRASCSQRSACSRNCLVSCIACLLTKEQHLRTAFVSQQCYWPLYAPMRQGPQECAACSEVERQTRGAHFAVVRLPKSKPKRNNKTIRSRCHNRRPSGPLKSPGALDRRRSPICVRYLLVCKTSSTHRLLCLDRCIFRVAERTPVCEVLWPERPPRTRNRYRPIFLRPAYPCLGLPNAPNPRR